MKILSLSIIKTKINLKLAKKKKNENQCYEKSIGSLLRLKHLIPHFTSLKSLNKAIVFSKKKIKNLTLKSPKIPIFLTNFSTFDELGFIAKIGGHIDGITGGKGLANGPFLLLGFELDGWPEIHDLNPPLLGSQKHLH